MNYRKIVAAIGVVVLFIVVVLIIQSCDSFERDASPKLVVNDGDKSFYTLPNSATVIDLKGYISSYENVEVILANESSSGGRTSGSASYQVMISQPLQGSLTKLEGTLLKYTPARTVTNGKDFFSIRVLKHGKELHHDSVTTVVCPDTTRFPCHLYAVADTFHVGVNKPDTLNVLENDRICGVNRSKLTVLVHSLPKHGHANVVKGGLISYTPDAGYEGADSFVYTISATGQITSYGSVSVSIGGSGCIFKAVGDSLNAKANNVLNVVNVLNNDQTCGATSVTVLIKTPPKHGEVAVGTGGIIKYYANSGFTGRDSLVYAISAPGEMTSYGSVSITVLRDSACVFTAVRDFYPRRDSTIVIGDTLHVNILNNDILCSQSLSSLRIVTGNGLPRSGSAVIQNNMLIYTLLSVAKSDSVVYELCSPAGCSRAGVVIQLK